MCAYIYRLRLTEKEKTKITEDPFRTDKKRLDELFIIDDEFSEAWVCFFTVLCIFMFR